MTHSRQPKTKPAAAPRVAVYLRLEPELRDALYRAAHERGITVARLASAALREWLERNEGRGRCK